MTRLLHAALALAAGLFLWAGPAAAQGNPCGLNPAKIITEIRHPHKSELTVLVAHRGLHAQLHTDAFSRTPENSRESLDNVAATCFEAAEIDIRRTSDGVLVLSHDFKWGRASFAKYVDYAVSSLPEPKPHFAERKAKLVAAYRKEQAKHAEKLNWARIEPGIIKAFGGIDPRDAAAIEAFYRTPAGKAWAKASPAVKIGIADAVTKVTKEIAPDTFEATEQLQKKVDAIKLDRLNHAGGKE
ncbi:hypothetical protein CA233_22180 [Sphingomonas sp. ABOLD]|uniref:GP-PDE domain-containing protein n=1 Tax=Sphingomonas trueperi TaxID=53317 RepID=A0A7X5Y2Q6_9SPHN|nr:MULTISPECIES: glycerophosphodiester phosphodiesterase family protein [Sphingomonas]NJB99998.1 hypothetical protein [Sphingomonas trueperi]RSV37347.1 hypothetical protein CA233_22180 [Sphingomonas sp. ABOLD]RSV38626.1 hypothetical protein CA234_16100 [Sphingomonas sp. ABOLE]